MLFTVALNHWFGFCLLVQIGIAEKLVKVAKVPQQSIVILSPYNAQVSEIRDELRKKKMDKITVTTITKSQGNTANIKSHLLQVNWNNT